MYIPGPCCLCSSAIAALCRARGTAGEEIRQGALVALRVLLGRVLAAGAWFASPSTRTTIATTSPRSRGGHRARARHRRRSRVHLFPRLGDRGRRRPAGAPPGFGETPFARLAHARRGRAPAAAPAPAGSRSVACDLEGLAVELGGGPTARRTGTDLLSARERSRVPRRPARRRAPPQHRLAAASRARASATSTSRRVARSRRRRIAADERVHPGRSPSMSRPASGWRRGALSARGDGRGEAVRGTARRFELRRSDRSMWRWPLPAALGLKAEAPAASYVAGELRVDRPRVKSRARAGHIGSKGRSRRRASRSPRATRSERGACPGPRARRRPRAGRPRPPEGAGARTRGGYRRADAQDGRSGRRSVRTHLARLRDGHAAIDAPVIAGRVTLAPFSPRAFMERIGHAAASPPTRRRSRVRRWTRNTRPARAGCACTMRSAARRHDDRGRARADGLPRGRRALRSRGGQARPRSLPRGDGAPERSSRDARDLAATRSPACARRTSSASARRDARGTRRRISCSAVRGD